MEHLKNWSISTYKYTGNTFPKGLVKVQGLWIPVLEGQIMLLKEAQVKCMNVLKLAKQMSHHFHGMIQSQRGLAEAFTDLGVKSPEL